MEFSAAALGRELEPELKRLSAVRRWVVGYSGGLDSTVLLHSLTQLPMPILAVHVNHQLAAEAGQWEQHCSQWCQHHRIAYQSIAVDVPPGSGLEDKARRARYAAFFQCLQAGDGLTLAHQQDDQIETVVFRLFRGAGVKGLGGMSKTSEFRGYPLVRPLLGFSRSALLQYARRHELNWIEDDSNHNQRFDRNFLRAEIIPLIKQRWPQYALKIAQAANHCRHADQLSRQLGELDLENADEREARWGFSLDWRYWRQQSLPRRENLLRSWVQRRHFPLPEIRQLEEIDAQFNVADPNKAVVSWSGCAIRFYRDRLYLTPATPPSWQPVIAWDIREPLDLSVIQIQIVGHAPPARLTVRPRQKGDRCRPQGRTHSQTLKKLFQEYQLEPWLRDCIPVFCQDQTIVAVGDLWVCDETPHYRIKWSITP